MNEVSRPTATGGAPTIKDVAALANVSWRTVSNVVNGHRYISDATRAKVEAAIQQLGYRPQVAARQLRSGRSGLLTLSVPHISHPYFSQLAHAVILQAEKRKYDVVVDETRGEPDRELRVASGYRKLLTDGILFTPQSIDRDAVEDARDDTPLVILGEHIRSSTIDSVFTDNVRSAFDATQHLLALGRKRIAFLGYLQGAAMHSAELRIKGYQLALDEASVPDENRLLLPLTTPLADTGQYGDYSREAGYERIHAQADDLRSIDGLVCGNDLLAIGALRALRELGIRVPDEIAVIARDNIPDAAYATPSLSTIAPDLHAIAATAIDLLLRRIEEPNLPTTSVSAPYELIVRESSGQSV